MIIGITGTDGAGKGELVNFLVQKYGFVHFSSRALLIEEIEKKGLSATRDNMRITGNALREKKGAGVIVEIALEKIFKTKIEKAIVESIRSVKEVETLKEAGGILLAVDAPLKIRYERISGRGGETDKVSFEEFVEQEEKELNDKNPNGMQKAEVMKMADYTFLNDSSLEELHKKIEEWYRK